MFDELDPLIHSPLRLAIMSLLMGIDEADFVFLKEKTQSTAGNLSVQVTKLEEAGYIKVLKGYKGKRPQTTCRITQKGEDSFRNYVDKLQSYITPRK